MKFEQKKKGNKYTFTLYDNYFNLSYDTQSGSGDKNINYADFPKKCSIRIEQHEWLKNVGYVWTIAGIYNLGNALYYNAPASGQGIWILSGITCILLAYLSKTKYSVFRTENGIIPIIQDKYHDQIINEINKRKKAQLLEGIEK